LTTKCDPKPFTDLRRKGVSVELARGEARLSRNLSIVKKVIPATKNTDQSRGLFIMGMRPDTGTPQCRAQDILRGLLENSAFPVI